LATITTVCGPVDPADLGFTSMHEHVLTDASFYLDEIQPALEPLRLEAWRPSDPDEAVRMEDLAYLRAGFFALSKDAWNTNDEPLMTAELADFKKAGGSAVLDCSAPGIRPNVAGLRRVSEASGVHIVASTGLYAERSWPERFREMSSQEFESHVRSEIDKGMEGTDIRPGQIKCATNEVTDKQVEFLKASARVSRDTDYPLTAHLGIFTAEEDHRQVLRILLDAGIAPERLIMCHMQGYVAESAVATLISDPSSWQLRLDYVLEVLDLGVNLCFDCFGLTWSLEAVGMLPTSDVVNLAAVYALLEKGYADQITVGTDTFTKPQLRRYGGYSYCRLLNFVVPWLRNVGVDDATLDKLTVANPARILAR